jgi:AcrR family transcriptional regulator
MPKIIENVREDLLREAKRQITEQGYKATTIRSVAAGCGVAVGTVYNYFSSKDMLIAHFMLEDWRRMTDELKSLPTDDKRAYLLGIYTSLRDFAQKHSALFKDEEAAKVYGGVFLERHGMLRAQLAELISPVCGESGFTAEFVAESMLTWTMADRDFDEIYSVIKKIII